MGDLMNTMNAVPSHRHAGMTPPDSHSWDQKISLGDEEPLDFKEMKRKYWGRRRKVRKVMTDPNQSHHRNAAASSDHKRTSSQQLEAMKIVAEDGKTDLSAREPRTRNRKRGTRISKHLVKLPSLKGLSSLARRNILGDLSSGFEQETPGQMLAEGSLESFLHEENFEASDSCKANHAGKENDFRTESVDLQGGYEAEQSKLSSPGQDPVLKLRFVSKNEEERPLIDSPIRRLNVGEGPTVKIRKHLVVKSPTSSSSGTISHSGQKIAIEKEKANIRKMSQGGLPRYKQKITAKMRTREIEKMSKRDR